MKVEVYIKSRRGDYEAKGVFEDGKLIVKKGSKIKLSFAEHIRGGQKARSYRDDPAYVDAEGNVLKDCEFGSPSTAAQFITGTSTNGYTKWFVKEKTTLSKYLGRDK